MSIAEPKTCPNAPQYRMDLSYLGSDFRGWQSQPGGEGVQDHIERALGIILRHEVRLVGASRTDTGVHAEHQVATFRSPVLFDERRWLASLTGLLPASIGVRKIAPSAPEFHPIYSAKAKVYRYRIWNARERDPFLEPFTWRVLAPLDIALMRREAAVLVGQHDFTSFCAADATAATRVRTIYSIDVDVRGPLIDIWVMGSGFLKQMVRTIVGTLVGVAAGRSYSDGVAGILAQRDRQAAGQTAPAQGLSLVHIFYDEPHSLSALKEAARQGYCLALHPY